MERVSFLLRISVRTVCTPTVLTELALTFSQRLETHFWLAPHIFFNSYLLFCIIPLDNLWSQVSNKQTVSRLQFVYLFCVFISSLRSLLQGHFL
jgi:hypothetical protein